jgi:hypothetical protein
MTFYTGSAKPKSSGRKKGVTNKKTAELKDMIRNALDMAGGEQYLLEQARENPAAFLSLVGKIIPKDLNVGGQQDNPIKIAKIELVPFSENKH